MLSVLPTATNSSPSYPMETYSVEDEVYCSNAIEGHAACPFDPTDGVVNEDVLGSCTVCDSNTVMRCSICGTPYCNPQCLKKDWPHHKALCKTIKDESGHNGTNTVRAILFPMDSQNPTWMRINLKALDISIVRALGIAEKKPFKNPANKLILMDINKSLTHRWIGRGIRQFTAPNARFATGRDNSLNQSIFALADPGSLRPHFGSAIFLCFRTHEIKGGAQACRYEDATPRDLRMIIEWYYTHPDNPYISKLHRLPIKSYSGLGHAAATPLWPAVQILCNGDHLRLGVLYRKGFENIQNVQVLSTAPFHIRAVSEIPRMAGLPWLVQPCHTTIDPLLDTDESAVAALLHNWAGRIYALNKQSNFTRWNRQYADGWLLPEHLDSTHFGSMIVLHERGCVIDKAHIVCFNMYVDLAFQQVTPLYTYERKAEGEGEEDGDGEAQGKEARVVASREELMRFITKEGFKAFWEEWIQAEAGKFALLYPSPYNEIYAGEVDPVSLTEEEIEAERKRVEEMLLEPVTEEEEEKEAATKKVEELVLQRMIEEECEAARKRVLETIFEEA